MEKERSSKILAVIALIVAVVGLTVGFAAYTRSLNITNLEGTVNPGESELDIFFDNDQEKGNDLAVVKGVGDAALATETGATITNPELNSGSNPTISGFQAQFKQKGQKVEYTFYVYNNSPYAAYLEKVNFTGDATHKTCEAIGTATNAALVENACKDINISLKIDDTKILSTNAILSSGVSKV